MFNINDRFDFFDEPINLFNDNRIDFYFEKDRRDFKDSKLENIFNIKKAKYNNFYKNYIATKQLNLSDFSNNSQWEEASGILQNKDIGDSQSATLEGTLNNITTISFYCKVSSEQGYDFLTIYINGEQKIHISGNVDWTFYTYTINGDIDFKAIYSKDSSNSVGSDTGYLKDIKISHKVFTKPINFNILRDYVNFKDINKYNIKNYTNFKDINKYNIKNYTNLQNFCFERLGRKQFLPKRIIIKGFND